MVIHRIVAHSRLHFGLVEIRTGAPYCFGGVGMMVSFPSVCLEAHDRGVARGARVETPQVPEYWRDRFRSVFQSIQSSLPGLIDRCVEVRWPILPEPHIGFGSGTQFSCAVVRMLMKLACESETSAREDWDVFFRLMNQVGRGKRSQVGLRGFMDGGLIFDAGGGGERVTQAYVFPDSWRVLALWEPEYAGDSGQAEQDLFNACSHRENPYRDEMIGLIQNGLLPGINSADWERFSSALGRYGECAGEVFRLVQGDVYRSARIRFWVDKIRSLGVMGVGQSSWGPVVYAILPDSERAEWLRRELQPHLQSSGWIKIGLGAGPAEVVRSH